MKTTRRSRERTTLLVLCLVLLSLSIISISTVLVQRYAREVTPQSFLAGDPLGNFQEPGPLAPMNWTGDGQRITNPSFEAGTSQPWVQLQSNAATGSGITIMGPGYDGNLAAEINVRSGNASTSTGPGSGTFFLQDSSVSLLDDLRQEQIGFGSAIRLRATVLVDTRTGNSAYDRADVAVILETSVGDTRTIHYVIGARVTLGDSADTAYFSISGPLSQWVTIDRNVAADALAKFPADFANLNSVREVTLSVHSKTTGNDPRIKYLDTNNNFTWNAGEPVVYDSDDNRFYHAGEPVIYGSTPPDQSYLQDDPRITFIDTNGDNIWNQGESVVYDSNQNNQYDSGEPVLSGPTPADGTRFFQTTIAHFDKIELYSATGNYEWLRNNGFESGSLAGWGSYGGGFQVVSTNPLSGSYGAQANTTNGTIEMAQSVDGEPSITSWSKFKASVYVSQITGTSNLSVVEVWLGLADNSSLANPAFVHYLFKTGDGTIPMNSTDSLYVKAPGFGTQGRWLNLTANLPSDTGGFNSALYSPSFHVIAVGVKLSAGLGTTTAYLDDFSLFGPYLPGPYKSGSATSYRYAVDGLNSTYVYTTPNIPQGSFFLVVPSGQSVLNITGPEGNALAAGDFIVQPLAGRIDVPDLTCFKHDPSGSWRVITTSTNAVSTVYGEDPSTGSQRSVFGPNAMANLVSRSQDPFASPLSAASVNLTLWTSSGTLAAAPWVTQSSNQGWANVSSIVSENVGVYWLQAAASSASYVGLRTFRISVLYTVTVSISLSTTEVTSGSPVDVYGSIEPIIQGITVTILYRQAGDSNWTTLTRLQTDEKGAYRYTWLPPEGFFELSGSTQDDPDTVPVQSAPSQLLVNPGGFSILQLGLAATALATVAVITILMLRRRRMVQSLPTTRPDAAS